MTPEDVKSDYRAAFERVGEVVLIRRYTGTGASRPYFDAGALARPVNYDPHELVGSVVQGDVKLIVLAQDLFDAQFPVPPKRGDKAVVRGKELNIEAVDDNTRRVQGVLVAYDLQVRG